MNKVSDDSYRFMWVTFENIHGKEVQAVIRQQFGIQVGDSVLVQSNQEPEIVKRIIKIQVID